MPDCRQRVAWVIWSEDIGIGTISVIKAFILDKVKPISHFGAPSELLGILSIFVNETGIKCVVHIIVNWLLISRLNMILTVIKFPNYILVPDLLRQHLGLTPVSQKLLLTCVVVFELLWRFLWPLLASLLKLLVFLFLSKYLFL